MFDAKHLLGALMGTGFGGANRRPGFEGGGLFGALGQAMQQGGGLGGAGGILDKIGGMSGGGRGSGLAAVAGLAGLTGVGGKLGKGLGLAALGGLALHALQNYQQRQGEASRAGPAGRDQTQPGPAGEGQAGEGPAGALEAPEAAAASVSEGDAILLIRAMVAAANADGRIDADEQRRIERQLEGAAVSDDERDFLAEELRRPVGVEEIARGARTPELAQQVYAASLLAMTADTPAEQSYLRYLADRCGLSAEETAEIHRQLGV